VFCEVCVVGGLLIDQANFRDAPIEVGVGFIFDGPPVFVLARSDRGPAKQIANPTTTYRRQHAFKLQLQ